MNAMPGIRHRKEFTVLPDSLERDFLPTVSGFSWGQWLTLLRREKRLTSNPLRNRYTLPGGNLAKQEESF